MNRLGKDENLCSKSYLPIVSTYVNKNIGPQKGWEILQNCSVVSLPCKPIWKMKCGWQSNFNVLIKPNHSLALDIGLQFKNILKWCDHYMEWMPWHPTTIAILYIKFCTLKYLFILNFEVFFSKFVLNVIL